MPLPAAFERLGQVREAARRIFAIADAVPAVREPAETGPRPGVTQSGLSFREVRFRYAPDRQPALDNASFDVRRGEHLGIVGSSGAGKSSIVSLLARFWEREQGSILVDGRDIRELGADEARALFSVATQTPYLFHTSIRENLLLAAPGASQAELDAALSTAQLARLVASLPEGLDTQVGETGQSLSAGEARRIAVARALLRKSPYLILDEPTEDLDAPTGRSMMEAIHRAEKGRTVIVITHHLHGLGNVDRVLVLERGKVVEQGTPAELKRSGRLFRQLLELADP
jgi:ATP-binding cassette subfamily C protein CydC